MEGTSPRRKYLLNRGEVSPLPGSPSLPYGTQC